MNMGGEQEVKITVSARYHTSTSMHRLLDRNEKWSSRAGSEKVFHEKNVTHMRDGDEFRNDG